MFVYVCFRDGCTCRERRGGGKGRGQGEGKIGKGNRGGGGKGSGVGILCGMDLYVCHCGCVQHLTMECQCTSHKKYY